LAWEAIFVGVSVLMAAYLIVRWAAGLLVIERRATIEAVRLFIGYAAAQALIALGFTRAFALLGYTP
jgi:hypothetical protein